MTHAQWFPLGCSGQLVYVRADEHRAVGPQGVIESVVAVYQCGGCGMYVRRRHLLVAPPEGQLASLGRVAGFPVSVWPRALPPQSVEDVSRHFLIPE